jgi:hypothetical protein
VSRRRERRRQGDRAANRLAGLGFVSVQMCVSDTKCSAIPDV